MTECNSIASTPVLVAIDISKGRHEILIEVPDKKRRRRVSTPYVSLLKQPGTIIAH